MRNVDVAIVGSGHAGLNALKEVKKSAKSWVLINAGELGTTCVRVGCMPSKAIIGLGPIGIEMGQALHRLSVNVTGFSKSEKIAAISDPVINKAAIDIMSREFPLYLEHETKIWTHR